NLSANVCKDVTDRSSPIDLVRPNERNEYDVAEGISAACFRVVMDFYHRGIMHVPQSICVAELREQFFFNPTVLDHFK
uniref:BTB_3 domain-containing protein n=1 Tax=Globodera pallida TaxID=36090 RepID=A0A183CTX4_GLOPA